MTNEPQDGGSPPEDAPRLSEMHARLHIKYVKLHGLLGLVLHSLGGSRSITPKVRESYIAAYDESGQPPSFEMDSSNADGPHVLTLRWLPATPQDPNTPTPDEVRALMSALMELQVTNFSEILVNLRNRADGLALVAYAEERRKWMASGSMGQPPVRPVTLADAKYK